MGVFVENSGQSHRCIAKQFGIDNWTVSRVVKSFKETQTIQRRAGSGRKTKTTDPVNARKARDCFKRNLNLPIRDVAKKVNSSVWFVQQTIKWAGLHVFKVRKTPNRTDKQKTVAKSRAQKLYREWLVGAETYYIKVDAK
ncbi:uncharacterized protein LOC135702232 [Ochlerotatus camptorhynchus]|uniref:uncharacterized protein LOC135702232 n=1 Tax=Ochlerotatus camptorhynchus TaxID=644619 RepID=UPI0031D2BEC1